LSYKILRRNRIEEKGWQTWDKSRHLKVTGKVSDLTVAKETIENTIIFVSVYSSQHVGTIVCFLVSVFVTLCRQIILDLPLLLPQLQVIKFNQTFSVLVNKTTNCKTGTTTSTNISLKNIEKTYRKSTRHRLLLKGLQIRNLFNIITFVCLSQTQDLHLNPFL
jgi:hypothetical protein